ncbi:restriction endonuclease [Bradyrhizobium elkanii]|uniref:restriction endonuclease n=1 Tax=Bradyrhizobium elkanii TaxID=29448 RepID=UPI0012BC4CEE|nr:restriction endonuclease [Bradyrhizobium elkanii]
MAINRSSAVTSANAAIPQRGSTRRAAKKRLSEGRLVAGAVRYIKLGEKGKWAADALENGILPFGYRPVDHAACARGDWATVRQQLIAMGRRNGGIRQGLRELREFYELGEDTLWFTIADGHLWWTFAKGRVIETSKSDPGSPSRFRRTGGWRKTSLSGVPLSVRSLSSALTSTANYQMTLCAVRETDYLLRRIRGEDEPLPAKAATLRAELAATLEEMIRRLDWKDFETLIDLIFHRGGWERISQLGGEQSDVDLVLRQPITRETAWVQVKSRASQAEFDDYLARFERDGGSDHFFFVYHSAIRPIRAAPARTVHLWSADRIANAALEGDLTGWISERVA